MPLYRVNDKLVLAKDFDSAARAYEERAKEAAVQIVRLADDDEVIGAAAVTAKKRARRRPARPEILGEAAIAASPGITFDSGMPK